MLRLVNTEFSNVASYSKEMTRGTKTYVLLFVFHCPFYHVCDTCQL